MNTGMKPAPLKDLTVGDLKKALAAVDGKITVAQIREGTKALQDTLPLRTVLAMLPSLAASMK